MNLNLSFAGIGEYIFGASDSSSKETNNTSSIINKTITTALKVLTGLVCSSYLSLALKCFSDVLLKYDADKSFLRNAFDFLKYVVGKNNQDMFTSEETKDGQKFTVILNNTDSVEIIATDTKNGTSASSKLIIKNKDNPEGIECSRRKVAQALKNSDEGASHDAIVTSHGDWADEFEDIKLAEESVPEPELKSKSKLGITNSDGNKQSEQPVLHTPVTHGSVSFSVDDFDKFEPDSKSNVSDELATSDDQDVSNKVNGKDDALEEHRTYNEPVNSDVQNELVEEWVREFVDTQTSESSMSDSEHESKSKLGITNSDTNAKNKNSMNLDNTSLNKKRIDVAATRLGNILKHMGLQFNNKYDVKHQYRYEADKLSGLNRFNLRSKL